MYLNNPVSFRLGMRYRILFPLLIIFMSVANSFGQEIRQRHNENPKTAIELLGQKRQGWKFIIDTAIAYVNPNNKYGYYFSFPDSSNLAIHLIDHKNKKTLIERKPYNLLLDKNGWLYMRIYSISKNINFYLNDAEDVLPFVDFRLLFGYFNDEPIMILRSDDKSNQVYIENYFR